MSKDYWLSIAGSILVPIIGSLFAFWAALNRKIHDHDVLFAKLEARVESVEKAVLVIPEIRELISKDSERLVRIETGMTAIVDDIREHRQRIERLLAGSKGDK